MKRLAFLAMLLATPAVSAPITVTLDDGTTSGFNDQKTITDAIDAYLKAQGIAALMPSAALWQKLQAAAQTANQPPVAPAPQGATK